MNSLDKTVRSLRYIYDVIMESSYSEKQMTLTQMLKKWVNCGVQFPVFRFFLTLV